jgi:hypothetical protein
VPGGSFADALRQEAQALGTVYASSQEEAEALYKIRSAEQEGGIRQWLMWYHQKMLSAKWDLYEKIGKPIRWLVLKWRQGGISTLFVRFGYKFTTTGEYRYSYHLTHNTKARRTLTTCALTFRKFLPVEMQPQMMPGTELGHIRFKDPSAASRGRDEGLNSEMMFVVASDATIGNAQFCHFFHWTETGRTPRARELWAEFAPVIKANINVWETNANGKTGDGAFLHEQWQLACGREDCDPSEWESKGSGFLEPIFLRAYDDIERTSIYLSPPEKDRLLNDLDSEEQRLIDERGLIAEQIGWRREQVNGVYGGRVDEFYMNYPDTPGQAFGARGKHFFPMEGIEFVHGLIRKPLREGRLMVERPDSPLLDNLGRPIQKVHIVDEKGGPFRFWELPEEKERVGHGERLMIGADPCLGAKSDEHPEDGGTTAKGVHSKAAAQVLDRLRTPDYEGRIIVDYLNNVREREFAFDLMLLGMLYGFPLLGLARRIIGETAMDWILQLGYPYRRIYQSIYSGAPDHGNRYSEPKLGFWEDQDTRGFAYQKLAEILADKRWEIYSDRILISLEAVTGDHVYKKPHKKIDEILDDPADACAMLARMDNEYPPYIGESDQQVERREKIQAVTVWDVLRMQDASGGDPRVLGFPKIGI